MKMVELKTIVDRLQKEIENNCLLSISKRYRIWTDNSCYKIQKKEIFRWVWLDECEKWCNWYGKNHPKIFYSSSEMVKFLSRKREANRWHIL